MGTNPRNIWIVVIGSVKITLNASIKVLSVFLYQYMESFVFLEIARTEGIAP